MRKVLWLSFLFVLLRALKKEDKIRHDIYDTSLWYNTHGIPVAVCQLVVRTAGEGCAQFYDWRHLWQLDGLRCSVRNPRRRSVDSGNGTVGILLRTVCVVVYDRCRIRSTPVGIGLCRPLRRSGCTTLLEIVGREYGRKAETLGSVLFLAGIFISIMAQVLSSSAMIGSLFGIPMVWASVIGALLIMLFVLFGGIRSAGASGIIKLILLYFSSLAAGVVVWHIGGGFSGLRESIDGICQLPAVSELNALPDIESIHHRYGSMLARGVMKDLGGCLSLILGVVSTQTYAQCIWSGADTPRAKRGTLLCAFFIPIIGAACTLVGIYMRGHYITAEEWDAMQKAGETIPAGVGIIAHSAQAFPQFILNHLPDWLGGIMLGTLLINITKVSHLQIACP